MKIRWSILEAIARREKKGIILHKKINNVITDYDIDQKTHAGLAPAPEDLEIAGRESEKEKQRFEKKNWDPK